MSQEEIKKTPISDWGLIILDISMPQLSLINEQFALIIWKPTINRNFHVVPRINNQWEDLDIAISQIKEFLLEFEKDSFGYSRFQKFLKSFMLVKDLKLDPTFSEDKHLSNLVFVYDKAFPEKEPIVYSSVNKAMKALLISHGTLMDYIANQYIFRNNLALSFEPISPEVLAAFSEKPVGDNLARREIIVFNENNELVYEFKSGREMARYFGIDGKVARSAAPPSLSFFLFYYYYYSIVKKR